MKEIYHKIIMLSFAGIIAFVVGYSLGFYFGIRFMVFKAFDFLKLQGVDFSIPAAQIAELVNKYLGIIATNSLP